MANETILIVDADTKSQKVLEVSFKKAGYRVVMTDGPARARELVQDVSPDIIISDTQFQAGGDGFEFLADVKTGPCKGVPFIFLTEERALPQKMKGFELGADDYLTKPIYIKEVTTRVELLLQKRAKDQLTEDDVEELEGNIANITMIDLLQTIEEELRSGTIHLNREGQSAVIYFREGNILDAICGKLQGEEAIYRLMLWPDGEFVLRYHDQVRRVDRIEKDSGALLLEGIRRLDVYNELIESLPPLHHVFEADYSALSGIVDELPAEVSRILRLFDGLRSVREVTDGSPVDDVTTLKIVHKLISDRFLIDVTPMARRSETPSRSNLAAWLDGVRSDESSRPAGLGREDTSPKFGASITEMAEKRSPEATAPVRETLESAQPGGTRDARDTDPFGSRSQAEKPRRKTLPLREAFDTIDAWEDEELPRDARRKTALQWDRPRSGWNIHFDAADDNTAAIREIEEDERKRREEEAKHLADVRHEATLRFAPAQDRASGPDGPNADILRKIEEDERRRRDEEARHLQAQLASVGSPIETTARRHTDELPIQPRMPAEDVDRVTTDELFADEEEPPELRERPTTPLSSPALQLQEDSVQDPIIEEGWDALAASDVAEDRPSRSAADAVSEADVFDDDSDEVGRLDPPPPPQSPPPRSSERVTLDIRPPAKVAETEAEPAEEVHHGGLFDAIGDEETSPGEELEELAIEVIEVMPEVPRQATDNELVRATYDLSLRKTITPSEIEGRPEALAMRNTVPLRAIEFGGAEEHGFFERDAAELDYEAPASKWGGGAIVVLVLGVMAIVFIGLRSGSDDPIDTPVEPIAHNTTAKAPVETIALEPEEPPGFDSSGAAIFASRYGANVGTSAQRVAVVMSGADLIEPGPDAGLIETPPIEVVAVENPPIEKPPVEKPPVDKPPIEEKPPVEKPPVAEKTPPPVKLTGPTSEAVKKAERLVKQEKFDEALAMLRQLSEAVPKDQNVAYLHGYAAFSSNKTGEAITHLTRAERLGYRTPPMYLDLAAALQLDGQKGRAKWAYEKFLELQPSGRQADEVRTILSTHF